LTRAIELAELLGETATEIAARIQRAAAADYVGQLGKAHEDLRRAATLSEEGGGWHLAFTCRANLAICQMRLGETRQAAESLAKAKQHYAPIGHPAGWFELRHLEGNLAVCREDLAPAERCYSDSMAGFYGLGQLGRAALVGLDQAILYAGQARWEEVGELLRSIPIALQTMTLHPETLATIAVVASDAAAMEITPAALSTLRRRLSADPLLALNFRSS
jgi:tetratricopeptide (TPR) repeat protein